MSMKKFVICMLVVAMAGSLSVGCGSSKSEAVASSGAAEESADAKAAEADTESAAPTPDESGFVGLADRTPTTLRIFYKDQLEDVEFTDPIAEKIRELTGVTLEIEHPVGGDEQAIPLMIASGDYPDMIFAKGDTGLLVDAEAIIPLDDYIEEKGSNLKALYGENLQRLKYSEQDPSIYTVGTYSVNGQSWETDGTMQIQHAVLKELGYPEIKTIYQYEDALQKYITKYPQIDGQDAIGLTLMGSDWRWLITVGNVASATSGIPDDGEWYINDETGEAQYKYFNEGVREYMKWLNHMNAIGLLDPESFTHQEDVYFAKLASGRVLGTATPLWGTNNANRALVSEGKAERTTAPLPVAISEDVKIAVRKNYGFSGGHGIGICATSDKKDKAFEFLDWMCSDEAQILINWGIEGVNYECDANGARRLTPEMEKMFKGDKDFTKKTGVTKYVYPFPQQGEGALDKNGNNFTIKGKEQIIANMNDAEKETLKAYGKELWIDFFPGPEELGVSKHGQAWQYNIASDSDLAIFNQKSQDFVTQAATQAILGNPDDFDSAWDDILKKLEEMGVKEANAEMTRLTNEKINFWSAS